MERIAPPGKYWHYGLPWEVEKRPVLKYFSVADKVPDYGIFRGWSYIFRLKPKKTA